MGELFNSVLKGAEQSKHGCNKIETICFAALCQEMYEETQSQLAHALQTFFLSSMPKEIFADTYLEFP